MVPDKPILRRVNLMPALMMGLFSRAARIIGRAGGGARAGIRRDWRPILRACYRALGQVPFG